MSSLSCVLVLFAGVVAGSLEPAPLPGHHGAIATLRPPNVVFILADDLGINDLHCYGRADHATPHLD